MTLQKKIMITGASRGMGRVLSAGLANDASLLVLTARRLDHLNDVINEIKNINPRCEIYPACGDLSNQAGADTLLSGLGDMVSSIDVLINNAGFSKPDLLKDAAVPDIISTYYVNFISPVLISKAVISGMIQRKWGRIINISSISAVYPRETLSIYSSAKLGLNGFTRLLSAEVAKHEIAVNAIMPGFMRTDMGREAIADMISRGMGATENDIMDRIKTLIPRKAIINPEEVLALIKFLIGDPGGSITGQIIAVSGGL